MWIGVIDKLIVLAPLITKAIPDILSYFRLIAIQCPHLEGLIYQALPPSLYLDYEKDLDLTLRSYQLLAILCAEPAICQKASLAIMTWR
jgi:hypothetical protein